ncbi:MAG TPA: phytanoyl-CoA dioxygenase family protein, partial [Microlunatus sp.]
MSVLDAIDPVRTDPSDIRRSFTENGFVVVPDALSADEVAALNAEAVRICRGELGAIAGGSGLAADSSDAEVLRNFLCIHFPHKISEIAARSLTAPRIVDVLTTVIGPNVKAMQSMLFIKSEGKPGQAWHQDEHFIPTRDRSLTAVWIALDDATVENGCLWVLPGSHRRGVLYPDREQDDPRFDCTTEAYGFPYRDEDAVPVEIAAGTALIFNGYLLHRSLENSGRHGYRRALANHYMSAESLL